MRRGRLRHIEARDAVYDHACWAGQEGLAWQPELHWPSAADDPFVWEAYAAGLRQRRLARRDRAVAVTRRALIVAGRIAWWTLRTGSRAVWAFACVVAPRHTRKLRRTLAKL
jgi:hypothetical protein